MYTDLARETNERLPSYTRQLVEECMKKTGPGPVAILGLSYKPDVDDTRKSPSLEIIRLLKGKAELRIFDPWVKGESNVGSLDEAVNGASVVVLATHHSSFIKKLTPDFLENAGVKAIVGARNVLDKKGIKGKGLIFKGIGR